MTVAPIAGFEDAEGEVEQERALARTGRADDRHVPRQARDRQRERPVAALPDHEAGPNRDRPAPAGPRAAHGGSRPPRTTRRADTRAGPAPSRRARTAAPDPAAPRGTSSRSPGGRPERRRAFDGLRSSARAAPSGMPATSSTSPTSKPRRPARLCACASRSSADNATGWADRKRWADRDRVDDVRHDEPRNRWPDRLREQLALPGRRVDRTDEGSEADLGVRGSRRQRHRKSGEHLRASRARIAERSARGHSKPTNGAPDRLSLLLRDFAELDPRIQRCEARLGEVQHLPVALDLPGELAARQTDRSSNDGQPTGHQPPRRGAVGDGVPGSGPRRLRASRRVRGRPRSPSGASRRLLRGRSPLAQSPDDRGANLTMATRTTMRRSAAEPAERDRGGWETGSPWAERARRQPVRAPRSGPNPEGHSHRVGRIDSWHGLTVGGDHAGTQDICVLGCVVDLNGGGGDSAVSRDSPDCPHNSRRAFNLHPPRPWRASSSTTAAYGGC